MTANEYNDLPRTARKARDAEIKAALTGWPQYVQEWEEYAAITLAGNVVYGETCAKCLTAKNEADEYHARNTRQMEVA